jgi:hypothetical protein
MASNKCVWAILAFCGSLFAAASVAQAADQPAEQEGKSKAKADTVVCHYVDSPGARLKRKVCGSPNQQSADGRMPPTGGSLGSPPTEGPGSSGFSNPANQSGYRQYR